MRCLAELVILVGVTDSTVAERVPAARRYPDPVHLVPPGPIAERVVPPLMAAAWPWAFFSYSPRTGTSRISPPRSGHHAADVDLHHNNKKGPLKDRAALSHSKLPRRGTLCSNAGHSFGYHLIRGVLEFRQSGQGKVHQTGRGRLQGRRGPGNLSSSLNGKPPP